MSNENILFIIDIYHCNIAINQLFMQYLSFLVFLQGNICYHGNDKKTVTSQTFSFIL